MAHDLIDHHREFCRGYDDIFIMRDTLANAASRYSKYDIARSWGQGWIDMYQINHGLMIGRGPFTLRSPWQCDYHAREGNLSLYILLAGKIRLSETGRSGIREFTGGSVLLHEHRATESSPLHYEQLPHSEFVGVSIEVPVALVKELRTDAGKNRRAASGALPLDMARLDPRHRCYQECLRTARMILHQSGYSTIGFLQTEAAALDLIANLFIGSDLLYPSGDRRLPAHQRSAVDKAMYILESEFNLPHTITALSRRVQLNECYLKSAFRKTTGYTIAQYLRKQRMAHARSPSAIPIPAILPPLSGPFTASCLRP